MPLHPQAREFLDALAERKGPGWEEMTPAQGRRVFAGLGDLCGEPPQVPFVEDRLIADGVPVRVYKPQAAAPLPVVLYFHGGGWVLGDLDTHDTLCRRLCVESSCMVIAVHYRRAPEHKYPAAFDDCYAATCYVVENAASLGADARRLAVAGDSAGGNLAAAVALKARDEAGPAIAAQVLVYPVVEPHFDSESYLQFGRDHGLTRTAMIWFWQQYLGHELDGAEPYAVPSRAGRLSGLPPALVVTAEYDVLRDEGERFAERLRESEVATTLRRYDGMIHGFVHFSAPFDLGRQALSDVAVNLRSMFAA